MTDIADVLSFILSISDVFDFCRYSNHLVSLTFTVRNHVLHSVVADTSCTSSSLFLPALHASWLLPSVLHLFIWKAKRWDWRMKMGMGIGRRIQGRGNLSYIGSVPKCLWQQGLARSQELPPCLLECKYFSLQLLLLWMRSHRNQKWRQGWALSPG